MTERCRECGTPVDEVPLDDCETHRQQHLHDVEQARQDNLAEVKRLIDELNTAIGNLYEDDVRIELTVMGHQTVGRRSDPCPRLEAEFLRRMA